MRIKCKYQKKNKKTRHYSKPSHENVLNYSSFPCTVDNLTARARLEIEMETCKEGNHDTRTEKAKQATTFLNSAFQCSTGIAVFSFHPCNFYYSRLSSPTTFSCFCYYARDFVFYYSFLKVSCFNRIAKSLKQKNIFLTSRFSRC